MASTAARSRRPRRHGGGGARGGMRGTSLHDREFRRSAQSAGAYLAPVVFFRHANGNRGSRPAGDRGDAVHDGAYFVIPAAATPRWAGIQSDVTPASATQRWAGVQSRSWSGAHNSRIRSPSPHFSLSLG